MTKWIVTLFFIFSAGGAVFAQHTGLEIKGAGNDFYLDHRVEAKENFYSIGRMYNVAPKSLASYNRLQMEAGLSVGQQLKIPLDRNNFTQSETTSVLDFLIPVHHTVTSGETLYRVGMNYNKVQANLIKKWNSLSSDALTAGSPLIVGFLKVDKNQSSLAKNLPAATPAMSSTAPAKENPPTENVSVLTQTQPEKKQESANVSVVTQTNPPAQTTETASTLPTPQIYNQPSATDNADKDGGKFKPLFDQAVLGNQILKSTGTAGSFKSTSGWQDGKYYCFNNDALPGSILKVTNNSNGRVIYAKVLDAIPDIKQNAGLLVIVSNAAADVLGAGESRFECVVEFVK